MRSVSTEKHSETFVLMTTHSETLLNAARPNEVLVVSMRDGCTIANRPINQEEIMQEISDTGFGLGHMYVTGVLDNG